MHAARPGERGRVSMLQLGLPLSSSPHGHQPGSSPNPGLLGFWWRFHYIDMVADMHTGN